MGIPLTSLHTHTVFCDGADDIETMCRAAYAKGLAAIGFSAHAPIGKTGLTSNWHIKDHRLDAYIDEVRAAGKRWEGKLPVYLGLEIDYIKGLRSALDADITALDLDYSIGSVHYLIPPRGDPFTIDGSAAEVETGIAEGFSGNAEAMMNAYWDAVAEMIVRGGFDIVGHLDLIKKNNLANKWFNKWFNEESDAYKRRTEEAARAISAVGMVVEISTGGINRGYFAETCPSLPIVRLLRRYNVPVMISADAHNANDLDGHYQTARQTLLDAGYTSHVVFNGRSNGRPSWQEIEL